MSAPALARRFADDAGSAAFAREELLVQQGR
jgi:hypothetical protein